MSRKKKVEPVPVVPEVIAPKKDPKAPDLVFEISIKTQKKIQEGVKINKELLKEIQSAQVYLDGLRMHFDVNKGMIESNIEGYLEGKEIDIDGFLWNLNEDESRILLFKKGEEIQDSAGPMVEVPTKKSLS
ncbi:MAG: hypothetical protein ABI002_09985 [Saprospiraceae bacterium]